MTTLPVAQPSPLLFIIYTQLIVSTILLAFSIFEATMKRREVMRALLAIAVPGSMVGCGGGGGSSSPAPVSQQSPPVTSVDTTPTPTITSLSADKAAYVKGQAPTVTAVFTNGTGRLDPGNLEIVSGVPLKLSTALSADTTLRLTVTSSAKNATRDLAISVSNGLPKWTAALSKARQGTARARIACIGDSTTSGVGSNAASATTNSRINAYPAQLAALLTSKYGEKASAGSIWGDGFEGANLSNFDPRITLSSGWQVSGTFVAGGKAFLDQTTTSPRLTFNPGMATDTLDVYFVTYSGYADFVVSTNGTFSGSGQTAGPQGVSKVTIKRPLSAAAWDIQKSSLTADRALMLVGFDAYDSTGSNVSVWNMGASGSRSAQWADGDTPYSFSNALPALAPDLSIIDLTINDWYDATPMDAYLASVQKIITAAKKTGDVLLVVGVPSNVETAPADRQRKYADAVLALAYKNDVPAVDLLARWVSQSYNPMRGFYFDGMHPSATGYADVAAALADVIGNP